MQFIVQVPPYEMFINKNQDKAKIVRRILEFIEPGDVIYGIVTRSKSSTSTAPVIVKPLCTGGACVRLLYYSNIKVNYLHHRYIDFR